jgi:hypothetical protein
VWPSGNSEPDTIILGYAEPTACEEFEMKERGEIVVEMHSMHQIVAVFHRV